MESEKVTSEVLKKEVAAAWAYWRDQCERKKEIYKESRERVIAAQERFRAAMEEGRSVQDSPEMADVRLSALEMRWQEWEESEALRKEMQKEAREVVESAAKRLNEVMTNIRQMTLPGM